jgi:hypothetical protein
MSEVHDRICVGCGGGEDIGHLEVCSICQRHFCADCAHKGFGRKFCSHECARAYYFTGETDDDEDPDPE